MTDPDRDKEAAILGLAALVLIFVFALLTTSLWLADGLSTSGKLLAQAGVVGVCYIAAVSIIKSMPR